MKITFFDEQDGHALPENMKEAAERALQQAAQAEDIDFCLNIMVTDDVGIARLNEEYRHVAGPTDVLSFPAYAFDGLLKDRIRDGMEAEREDGCVFIGDIAISLERALAQAEEYGHGAQREFAFLALHGTLHLLGYDHMTEEQDAQMRARQRELMEKADIPR